jgi:hypothetical protein
MLLIAVAATIICVIWIALDAVTEDVFIVYGRMIRTAWQMKAWSAFVSCGWRFALIAGVILLNISLAYQAIIGNRIDADAGTSALWCLAVLLAIGLVPWTFLVRTLHQRRSTNATAMMLTETATHLCTVSDLSSELERAEYTNESGWDAWHPTSERFQCTVVIPIDWTNFCVWGGPPTFAKSGKLLPFGGPGISRFRAGPGVRRLEAAGDSWIVQAELELSEETNETSLTNVRSHI